MVTGTPAPVFPCSRLCRPPRHVHHSLDLDATAVPCRCGECCWGIRFGGPIPARVECLSCGAGFNLEQLLRNTGTRPRPGGAV